MKITPKKSLGQNFLVNNGVVQKILSAAEVTSDDIVIEIGPGKGVLTEELGGKANRVIAIEKDHRLISDLKNTFREFSNVEIIESDVLKFSPYSILHIPYSITHNPYKVVANIPYYITSHLLKTIFESWPIPKLIVLMVQKEVAQRIMARPPRMNLLALSVQFYAEPKIISYVSRGSFRPMPKVDSAIIRLTPKYGIWNMEYGIKDRFFKLIKTAFAGKRKQLKNTVGREILEKAGIRPESRPEELSLGDWLKIAAEV